MTFPLSVRFNRPLQTDITPGNKAQVLQLIKDGIISKKADMVITEDMSVSYKGTTSTMKGSIFGSVDSGIFSLTYENDNWLLKYQIDMRELFIFTSILAVVMEVFTLSIKGPWWFGVAAFLWVCGANWAVTVVRHGFLANNIADEINEQTGGKPKVEATEIENDKMTGELKSWF
ncbi:hypothetical protein [Mucilaginibacter pedocola]|uniref:Uncharacterized protein n=1 Tax=Mucilaginibacter pedocola TaxID=1792845 RepID=A0A1S9PEP3_9SPHI|nr:hypothetical protein [Mucilaginibacter pedocola]OOQ59415.1 hypothetical protein BC343_04325 [Mucilaginibacter pedocola]